jgi:peptide/nickel transport system permease protein
MSLPGFLLALMLMVMAFHLLGLPLFGLFSPAYRDAPWSIGKFSDLPSSWSRSTAPRG